MGRGGGCAADSPHDHSRSKVRAYQALDEHFRRVGRRVYLASELAVYFPDEPQELIAKLAAMADAASAGAKDEARRAEDEARRAERYAARLRELGIDPDDIA